MPALGMRHTQRAQPAQSPVRDQVGAILEQMRVEPRRLDDRIGIEAELAQGRGDLLGHAELDVPGRQRARRCCREKGLCRLRWRSTAPLAQWNVSNLWHRELLNR